MKKQKQVEISWTYMLREIEVTEIAVSGIYGTVDTTSSKSSAIALNYKLFYTLSTSANIYQKKVTIPQHHLSVHKNTFTFKFTVGNCWTTIIEDIIIFIIKEDMEKGIKPIICIILQIYCYPDILSYYRSMPWLLYSEFCGKRPENAHYLYWNVRRSNYSNSASE